MPKFSKTKIIKLGYQLDIEDLNRLHGILDELNEPNERKSITYNVHFKNGERVTDLSLSELTKLPNIKQSTITSINVGTNLFEKQSLMITFNNWNQEPIEYHLRTEEKKELMYYQEKIENYIESLKTMYSPFSVSIFWSFVFLYPPITFVGIRSFQWISTTLNIPTAIINSKITPFLLGGALGILFALINLFLFPVAEFKFGYGIEKAKQRRWIHHSIILVLVLSFVSSIIDLLLLN